MFAPASLIIIGFALLGWAGWSDLRPQPLPYEQTTTPALSASLGEFVEAGLDSTTMTMENIEIRAPEAKSPIATGAVTRGADQRPTPLGWRNAVTEPVFFTDMDSADTAKVLEAIRQHAPAEAVVLAWWDMSRRIRSLAGRRAPLDDPLARGLLSPRPWAISAAAVDEDQRAYWGKGVSIGEGAAFDKFIDALLMDEARGVEALAAIAGGREAFIAVHFSDIWKAAASRPDLLPIAYRDFPGGDGMHGVMKEAREWMRENAIEGGYAVEPRGGAVRLHYLPRKADSTRLLARLLPFSTSNPLKLEGLELVYQHKGYWIYKLAPTKG
ncbi:hydroxylamine oxidation protein HaoB [Methylocystis heyeri]|uniref:Hydroxylamine oxidation protein HaoB n=1 Tax=Methylocystis heyeri TaxID=391905 RepID=A0A6B8KCC1_9HYPH|nr:hydroxylamine oxidation protein HaoB [Methylocystis heyeri]QGM45866.1 hydroxylamine oxidation protein HaoB [Methylocystis heyeri]